MSTPTRRASRFVRLARVCNAHRWRTFFAWLLALIAIQALAAAVGTKQIASFRLPGTESQRAYDLLAAHFPAAKGDSDQLVFKARSGKLTDSASKARIVAALGKVRSSGPVASVVSPFSPGGQVTKDGRIGVATINYKESTNDIKPATPRRSRTPRSRRAVRRCRWSTAVPVQRSFASPTAKVRRRCWG
ncbi:MAG: hypothetical protein QOJ29_3305 [Thermoleophilaceae bacterium]|nr:hypothetical protein [Thermoleophilaceae bacterium]